MTIKCRKTEYQVLELPNSLSLTKNQEKSLQVLNGF